jgi:hypothetical protein
MSDKKNPPIKKDSDKMSQPQQPSLLDLNGCNTKNNILDIYEAAFKKRDLQGWRRKK